MGFPPALWFGEEGRATDDALLAALKDRKMLLGIARQISPPPKGG